MRKGIQLLCVFIILTICGCKNTQSIENSGTADNTEVTVQEENNMQEKDLKMMIGDTEVQVEWENNKSVAALKELVKDKPLSIQMSMYGGFEQVGYIGTGLPRNDAQTVTESGDIVLYSGDQIVVFYGSNSWAYTRLGHITDKDAGQMRDLLSNGDVTITIRLGDA